MNTVKKEGTQTGRDYYIFQRELSGYVIERDGLFVPKWMAFFNGYTYHQLLKGEKRVKARAYTDAEKKQRFAVL
tara:strand:- start:362 stop:583 length:222 start_codon:yes stop_codon:yes gene_type:complete